MKFYRTAFWLPLNYPLQGDHPLELPWADCPTCGAGGAAVGLSCPIVLGPIEPKLTRALSNRRLREVPWDRYLEISNVIRGSFPEDALVAPGMGIGSLSIKVYKNPPLCYMPDQFTLIMETGLCRKLAEQGLLLRGGPVVSPQSKWKHLDYLNLWAPPIGESAEPDETLFCNLCQRHRGRRASSILASSIPSDPGLMHLWKLKDSSSFFVVSEVLMAQLIMIKDFNARFEELRIV